MAGAANAAPTARASALFFIPPPPSVYRFLMRNKGFHTLDSAARYKCALGAVNNERGLLSRARNIDAPRQARSEAAASAPVLFELVALRLEDAAKLPCEACQRQGDATVRRHF